MCTSFAAFSQSMVAMNFDFNAEYKLALLENNQFSFLVHRNKRYYRPLGVNRNGTFINMQLVNSCKEGQYRRPGQGVEYLPVLVQSVLTEKILPEDFDDFFANNLILNRRGRSVHSVLTTKSGQYYLIEPGRGVISRESFPKDYALVTNFPLADKIPITDDIVEKTRCRRYKTAHSMLEDPTPVSVDKAFDILENVKQSGGKLPTIFSIVCLLDKGLVYFSINGNFNKRYLFSFKDNILRSDKGFENIYAKKLTSLGFTTNKLEKWC